jgi:hypothetical protein
MSLWLSSRRTVIFIGLLFKTLGASAPLSRAATTSWVLDASRKCIQRYADSGPVIWRE